MKPDNFEWLKSKANEIRIDTIKCIGNLGIGHIGGSLSVVEALTVLYYSIMRTNPENPCDEQRDRFVLSKGHAGPALYCTLAGKGFFAKEMLATLNQIGTNLPSHCDMNRTPGIDMTAGSLGQGMNAAVGIALGMKIQKKSNRVFAIIGDGESQEGCIWEAAMTAAKYRLDNLIVMMDCNVLQIDGTVDEVMRIEPIEDKWRAFGWNVLRVDGHDLKSLKLSVEMLMSLQGKPSMLVMDTVKGKGAYFAEGKVASHNMPVSREELVEAVCQLEGGTNHV